MFTGNQRTWDANGKLVELKSDDKPLTTKAEILRAMHETGYLAAIQSANAPPALPIEKMTHEQKEHHILKTKRKALSFLETLPSFIRQREIEAQQAAKDGTIGMITQLFAGIEIKTAEEENEEDEKIKKEQESAKVYDAVAAALDAKKDATAKIIKKLDFIMDDSRQAILINLEAELEENFALFDKECQPFFDEYKLEPILEQLRLSTTIKLENEIQQMQEYYEKQKNDPHNQDNPQMWATVDRVLTDNIKKKMDAKEQTVEAEVQKTKEILEGTHQYIRDKLDNCKANVADVYEKKALYLKEKWAKKDKQIMEEARQQKVQDDIARIKVLTLRHGYSLFVE